METEVELLELLIKSESNTRTAFADKIGLSRQRINGIIREATENNGKLSIRFKKLLTAKGLDLYRYKRNPTNDFFENSHSPVTASETEPHNMTMNQNKDQEIIELLKREIELLKRLNEVEHERDVLRAQLPGKKQSRRRSA